jgi:hypothetical protein
MGWLSHKPILRDVEERVPSLPRMLKTDFFAPHTSEHPATMPLISTVSHALEGKGRHCETHSIEDMRSAVFSESVKLSKIKLADKDKAALEKMFRLKDALSRLRIVCGLLDADPEARIVEVHSLDADYRLDDRFQNADCFYRLPGSRILFLRDYIAEYLVPVRNGMELTDARLGTNLQIARAIIGMDRKGIADDAPRMLENLENNIERLILVEIPAPSYDGFQDMEVATRFQRSYGLSMSMHHALEVRDVQAFADILA